MVSKAIFFEIRKIEHGFKFTNIYVCVSRKKRVKLKNLYFINVAKKVVMRVEYKTIE